MIEIFNFIFIIQFFVNFYQNNVFRERFSRAMINKIDDDFKINFIVHDKLKINSKQYINFWFFLQNYLFIITFYEENKQTKLKLLIDFQKKFTFKLQRLIKYENEFNWNDFHVTLFIDSHKINAFLKKYEKILIIALKFKIII